MENIPLFEYDDGAAIIEPTHEAIPVKLPAKAVFAFVGDTVREYAREHDLRVVSEFQTITKRFPIYVGNISGEEYVLCEAPLGAPAAVQLLDWLIGYGVKKIVATGSCGVLTEIPENSFLIPVDAIRDEGTSYHYLPAARTVATAPSVVSALKKTLDDKKQNYTECRTWTTDAFYRETKKKTEQRIKEGCICVEMECAALAACAKFRGAEFGQLLFTADSLADADAHDCRDWGNRSLVPALTLCIETMSNL